MSTDLPFLQALTEYAFLQRALIAAVAVGVVSGLVGSIVILRGLSLMGDAISHAVLPGVAVSYMLGINLFFGAVATGLATALGITYVEQRTRLKSDTAIGVVFSAMFAIGVVLITRAEAATNLNSILFGNLLAVTRSDLVLTLVVAALAIIVVEVAYRHLVITTFDPQVARTYGSSPKAMHYLLMVVLTAVTVASLQAVGIILVVAMLVTPAATALLVSRTFRTMMTTSAVIGALAAVGGLWVSYRFNLPSGPAIVLVLAGAFLLAFIASRVRPRRGGASVAAGLAALLALGGCTDASMPPQEPQGLRVVTTFSLLGDLVTQIGGPEVQVHSMVPLGTDPHEYQPLPTDIEAATRADLIIWNGLEMETSDGWFTGLVDVAGRQIGDSSVVEASQGVEPQWLTEDGRREVNPHAFLSPRAGLVYAGNITKALSAADPANADGYAERGRELAERIERMDDLYEAELGSLANPVLVTSERAFQYVAHDYGLIEGYLWQIDTDEQGTPAQITGLIDFIDDHAVAGLLVETNVDPRPMETVSAETGVPIVGQVYSDELGAPGTPGETYLGYLQANLEAYLAAMN